MSEARTLAGLLLVALALASPALAPAQDEEDEENACSMDCARVDACTPGKLNPVLKEALEKEALPEIRDYGAGGAPYEAWATSMLKAEGKDPTQGKDPKRLTACQDNAHATWTCTYSARAAQDREAKTAWCEGKPDEGIGEAVLARVDPARGAEIWVGFGKSDKLFQANARPRKVRVTLIHAADVEDDQCGTTFKNPKVMARHEIELQDKNGYQPLPLPAAALPGGGASLAAIEILSVYPGKKYKDTCISEIRDKPE